ncbi:hypothetical protein [Peijinzhouia sedimentorum]
MRIIYLVTFLFIIGCNSQNEPQYQQWEELEFLVDENYLQPVISDASLGINFRPIKGFSKIESPVSSLEASEADFVEVRHLFKDDSTQSIMSVASIVNMPDSLIFGLIDNPDNYFNQDGIYNQAMATSFSFDNFKVVQLLLSNDAVVNFKLFFVEGGKEKFQLDYIFQRQEYVDFPKALESSIGSTKPIL